jgi:hypothetical protein
VGREILSKLSAVSQGILSQAWYPVIAKGFRSLVIGLSGEGTEPNKGRNVTRRDKTKINLFIDIALTFAFIVSLRPFLTGLAVHEWSGLAIGGALAVHVILHWKWVVGVTRKLLGKLPAKTRLYYVLDAGLFVGFATIIGSGVAMSQSVLPLLGLEGSSSVAQVMIHKLASYLTLATLVTKLALHQRWIANAVRRHLLGRGQPEPRQGAVPADTGL